jgi:hypothetical protein
MSLGRRPDEVVWSEQERELLDVARGERVPSALKARMRAALDQQLGAAQPGSAAVSSSPPPSAAASWFGSKLLWGTLGVLALGSAAYFGLERSEPTYASLAAATHAQAQPTAASHNGPVVAPPPAASATHGAVAAKPPPPPPAAHVSEGPLPPMAASAERHPALAGQLGATPSDSDRLRQEAELLDSARRALGRGALPQAKQLLERYTAQFHQGALLPEHNVLAIELQMRTGGKSVARAEAKRFLATYPEHPLRERVRALVAR